MPQGHNGLEAAHETSRGAIQPGHRAAITYTTQDVTIRYFLHAPNDVVMATAPLTLQFEDVVE